MRGEKTFSGSSTWRSMQHCRKETQLYIPLFILLLELNSRVYCDEDKKQETKQNSHHDCISGASPPAKRVVPKSTIRVCL